MAKFAQIEAATFKAISTLRLCELDVLQKAYLSEIWKLNSEIFMITDELESVMLIDRQTTRAIKKDIANLCDSREIVLAKLRAINRKRDNLEIERGEDKRCPKARLIKPDPAGYI
jgi:hypothetical protein